MEKEGVEGTGSSWAVHVVLSLGSFFITGGRGAVVDKAGDWR